MKSPVGLRGGYIVRLAFCLSKPGLETLHIAGLLGLRVYGGKFLQEPGRNLDVPVAFCFSHGRTL